MKTRLYYSFMVGTAIAMGNMRANPETHQRPAIITSLDSKSTNPAQSAPAPSQNSPHPSSVETQNSKQGGISLIA